MMMCSYPSSCIYFTVGIVDLPLESFSQRFHHVCQVEYVLLHHIHFDGGEQNIFHNCAGEIGVVRGFQESGRRYCAQDN